MKKIVTFFFIVILISSAGAQDDWKFSGQVQLRTEFDGRDFSNDTHPLLFASMRTRVVVEKTFLDKINFFVQMQDSRVLGEEANTLAAIDNIDLHQGYVTLKELFDWEWEIQAGRFEVAYGTERFLGAVGWHYIGRSWDGVRVKLHPGFKLDLFALTHTETVPYIGNAAPGVYPDEPTSTPSFSVYGFWESGKINEDHQLDFFGYYEVNRQKIEDTDDIVMNRFTAGLNHLGTFGNLSTILEAAYQFGDINTFDISAYLLSLQGSYKAGDWKFGAGADILSGFEDDSDSFGAFNPAFGTNHKFYGYMDYFINIPANTFFMGLNDFYFNTSWNPEGSKFNAALDFHHFMTKGSVVFTSGEDIEGEELSQLGQEVDLTIKYNFIKGTTLTWGASAFIPAELISIFFNNRDDVGYWSYLMITANL